VLIVRLSDTLTRSCFSRVHSTVVAN
jgi:hypothetical protein